MEGKRENKIMREGKKSFRFLNDVQFSALTGKDKADYLINAVQELEARQRKLREEMQELPEEQREPKD